MTNANGEHVVKERLPENVGADATPKEKPPKPQPPYKGGLRHEECAVIIDGKHCPRIRTNLDDPHSLCALHEWELLYGKE